MLRCVRCGGEVEAVIPTQAAWVEAYENGIHCDACEEVYQAQVAAWYATRPLDAHMDTYHANGSECLCYEAEGVEDAA